MSPPPGGADRNYDAIGICCRIVGRPHPGARIETSRTNSRSTPSRCRPHPGARIETSRGLAKSLGRASPPPGGADRNCVCSRTAKTAPMSPPPGGADRNSHDPLARGDYKGSPPPGGADRNAAVGVRPGPRKASPPPGGADRNTSTKDRSPIRTGRPHPGARIETDMEPQPWRTDPVAPTRGRGSKLRRRRAGAGKRLSPPPGGADRNRVVAGHVDIGQGRPHPGARIETSTQVYLVAPFSVAPTRGRGSKLHLGIGHRVIRGRPHPGARIETNAGQSPV